jgi:hypothetical protein
MKKSKPINSKVKLESVTHWLGGPSDNIKTYHPGPLRKRMSKRRASKTDRQHGKGDANRD